MKYRLAMLCLFCASAVSAQLPPGDGPVQVSGTMLEPTPLPFDDKLLGRLSVPSGFKISVFARKLENVRWLQVAANGDVYASRRKQGDVILLRDKNKDGVADEQKVVAQNIPLAHGLALREQQLFIASDRKVLVADIQPDGSLNVPRVLFDDLPDAGQHPNRTLAFGPDGKLYITVGSTCNVCMESNRENASIVTAQADGSARSVYAKGLRNTIGFGWHPVSQALYGFDHGADWRGDDQPPEELNQLKQNHDYGWPYCFADKQVDRSYQGDPPNSTKAEFCPTTEGPALTYTAHAAPIGMVFYTGDMFPAAYRNDAFVAFRGSWNRAQPSGYKIARVRFDAAGKPIAVEDFVSGWLIAPPSKLSGTDNSTSTREQREAERPAQFGRLAGLALWNDGSLLIAEDQGGVIYRVSYERQ